jgi:hypothetical protein
MTEPSPPRAITDDFGTAATARHCRQLVLKSVISERPTIMIVRRGQKQITRGSLNPDFPDDRAIS